MLFKKSQILAEKTYVFGIHNFIICAKMYVCNILKGLFNYEKNRKKNTRDASCCDDARRRYAGDVDHVKCSK